MKWAASARAPLSQAVEAVGPLQLRQRLVERGDRHVRLLAGETEGWAQLQHVAVRALGRGQNAEVAHAVGVSAKSVYEWEKHGGGIHWDHAVKLGKFYGVPPETVARHETGVLPEERLERIETLLADAECREQAILAALETFDAALRELTALTERLNQQPPEQ